MNTKAVDAARRMITGKLESLVLMDNNPDENCGVAAELKNLMRDYYVVNPWYTIDYILMALKELHAGFNLLPDFRFTDSERNTVRTIALILNPGAPFEGIGEVLTVVFSGFKCLVRLPGDAESLFSRILNYLLDGTAFAGRVLFPEGRFPAFDGLISINTLGNDTVKTYIKKYPNLHIGNTGTTATLTGEENPEQLSAIATGIGAYFGRSLFSIRMLEVPPEYDFAPLVQSLEQYSSNAMIHRYFNHYEYQKSLFLINSVNHIDTGFLLLTPAVEHTGKTAVVTYKIKNPEKHSGRESVDGEIRDENDPYTDNQCIISIIPVPHERWFYFSSGIARFLQNL